ncbi:metal ABC transporter solute-binding protein, Zn/Mn family [Texcoconibacillus texcoconensis]|uniref:Iron/zinc/copper transport system substrate-binding protein n=1 Tax=Texcoconibacillus texcoconensis TaxID=1095777 RepID=A0A840QSF0_9BACI|nr:zinc ABC transporter substrate-binding protein [Texcoconibacillus texcoconensis]MBB5174221.1 iron/zinc/copper transport system substrate-binding protein [Texcoconibacillus texcoconensis]
MFKSKSLLSALGLLFVSGSILMGCSEETDDQEANQGETEQLELTASFSVLADVVDEVVGDRGTVDYIVPLGEEPEEHEPTPSDFEKVTDSDLFFVNGLGLESWLESMMDNVTDTPAAEVTGGITPIPLSEGNADDPHAWLNPALVKTYVDNIVEELVELDPEGESTFTENAESFKEELNELDAWIEEQTEQIPEEHRFITISEDALVYFGEAYGFETEGIWELNAHEEGTPQQISRLVDMVTERGIPYVFIETTVSPNYMETVSENAGVPIFEEVIYSDALGEEGTGVYSYIDMMEHNVEAIVEALGQ